MITISYLGRSYPKYKPSPARINDTGVRKSSSSVRYYAENAIKRAYGSRHEAISAAWGGGRSGLLNGVSYLLLHGRGAKFTSVENATNHYEVLGVSPKATHKEIKSAYYNLSMTYHPDKNRDSAAAALKFREITAAYEILGNFLSRKNYDRGITPAGVDAPRQHGDGPYSSQWGPHQNHNFYRQGAVHTGRTPIYDFDQWMKEHYGETFNKSANKRMRFIARMERDRDHRGQKHVELMMAVIAFWGFAVMYLMAKTNPYDELYPVMKKNPNAEPPRAADRAEK